MLGTRGQTVLKSDYSGACMGVCIYKCVRAHCGEWERKEKELRNLKIKRHKIKAALQAAKDGLEKAEMELYHPTRKSWSW